MDAEKLESLEEVTRLIQEKWGREAVQTLKQYKAAYQLPTISTGIVDLDSAIGGLPCGQITLLHGLLTSGLTTLAVRLVAAAQRQHLVILYLDLSDTLNLEYAVTTCGVDEDHFVLYTPPDLAQALALTRDALMLPWCGVIVLDTVLTQTSPTILTSGLERLGIPLRRSNWTVIALLSPAVESLCQPYAALQLSIHHENWTTSYERIIGFQASISVLKHHSQPRQRAATFTVRPERV